MPSCGNSNDSSDNSDCSDGPYRLPPIHEGQCVVSSNDGESIPTKDGHDTNRGDRSVRSTPSRPHRARMQRPFRLESLRFNTRSRSALGLVRQRETTNVTGDIETNLCFVQELSVSHPDLRHPQPPLKRQTLHLMDQMGLSRFNRRLETDDAVKQYRLTTGTNYKARGFCGCYSKQAREDHEAIYKNSFSFASVTTRYLNWSFRTSFISLFVSFALMFWIWTFIFTGFLMIISVHRPDCIQIGDLEVAEINSRYFVDAYALSWTTFSTVGYGMVYPQISLDEAGTACTAVNVLMAAEAFTGVLFAALCGAILFGKISRIQAFANVQFSNLLTIKYGTGLHDTEGFDGHDLEGQNSRFPVLEFRIVNQLHNTSGGEILNSKITAVASIRESKASKTVRVAANRPKWNSHLSRTPSVRQNLVTGQQTLSISHRSDNQLVSSWKKLQMMRKDTLHRFPFLEIGAVNSEDSIGGNITDNIFSVDKDDEDIMLESSLFDEFLVPHSLIDEGSSLVPRRIFSPMELETGQHPCFKNIWIVRHVLNQRSPLINNKAKKMISENGGNWLSEWNTYEKVREFVHFHELIISFSGTSNASGSTVYKQNLYEFADLNVGYTFVDMTHQDKKTGAAQVDISLINEVVEQFGGGGEPLHDPEDDAAAQPLLEFENVTDQVTQFMVGADNRAKSEVDRGDEKSDDPFNMPENV